MANSFFIFFPGRSGSTFLVDLLRSHPAVRCEAEVFAISGQDGSLTRLTEFPDEKATHRYLDALYSSPQVAAGFKFKYPPQYKAYPDVFQYLVGRRDQMRCIVLHRTNLLKLAVSRQNLSRLQALGRPANLQQKNWVDLGPLNLDCASALRLMTRLKRDNALLFQAALSFPRQLIVRYEDLMADPQEVGARVCSFLGVERRTLAAKSMKITKDSLTDALANYPEVEEHLRGTEFEVFLDP